MSLNALLSCALLAGGLTACGGGSSPAPAPPSPEFGQPQRVTILGYTGDAMEPFISADLSTVYRGDWAGGTLSNVAQVSGIPASRVGLIIFDVGISVDGTTLCFAEGDYSSGTLTTANLVLADKTATGFTRSPQSAALLQQVNLAGGTQYAPAFSASGLELFFTRLQGTSVSIYTATRPSTTSAFGPPHVIQALTGFVEAPCLSPDGRSLYYHALVNSQFAIYRATRP